jgi:hypothetical protein
VGRFGFVIVVVVVVVVSRCELLEAARKTRGKNNWAET